MRKLARLLPLCLLAAASMGAGGISLDTGIRAEFTDCASGGSSATTLTAGDYLLRITDESVFLCFAASGSTCASGGEKFPAGTVMKLTIGADQRSVSCRSAASGGDAIFTRG